MQEQPEPRHIRCIPRGLATLGASIFVVQVLVKIVFGGIGTLLTFGSLLSVALTGLFAVPVVGAGLWLGRSDVGAERYRRVAYWTLAGLALILALNLVMIYAWAAETLVQNVSWAVQAAQMGAAGGVVFGTIEARSIERAREAERAAVRSEQLETQREWLEYLNSLLRHEVLNTANVVVGYSELLIDDHDGDDRHLQYLERIERQSRKMTDVIQDVRLLIRATNDEVEFRTVDVVSILEQEVRALRDRHDGVTVETSVPESASVAADDLLARVFSNLLENAVLHNDSGTPRVEVAVDADPESVTVTVADDGPGVPESERATLFERSGRGDHGLGLYLVRTLLRRYDGTVELAETGPDGSKFTVEIPSAPGEPTLPEGPPTVTADAARGGRHAATAEAEPSNPS